MTAFRFDEDEIKTLLAQLPAEVRSKYPPHILEPVRIEIARELVTKEFYKLFPSMIKSQMQTLPQTTASWLVGEGYTLDPITDFWNYVDGIMSTLRLKVLLVPYITSKHVSWRLEDIDPRSLALYAPLGTLGRFGKPPFRYDVIKRCILESPEQLQINKEDSDSHSKDTKLSRDHFPIVVLRKQNQTLQLLDGNRRCMRAYIYNKPTVLAWVGTVTADPPMYDHWINTGFMCRMLADYQQYPTEERAAAIRVQLHELFAASKIARLHYKDRCVKHFAFAAALAKGL
ncbi:MAG TPA: hypothetical protein VJ836_02960 [Candidatus Saccharimonadales bacterium]|nr:hypothetical protein [Candidatus Saccharimonadales bacterium]